MDGDRGVAAYDPDLAATCVLILIQMVALRAAGSVMAPPPSMSQSKTSARGAHESDARLWPT
eukprot:4049139-Pyramimonas_sp.AAC.1